MEGVKYEDGVVRCVCPDCNAVTNFTAEWGGGAYGCHEIEVKHRYNSHLYDRIRYALLRCVGCGRGGMAEIHYNKKDGINRGVIEEFSPVSISKAKVPESVPESILNELREAERCASVGAWRAGSAMLRSVLEKIFKENGYAERRLVDKINKGNSDGVITNSRAKKAHDDIRVLGNDVLHEKWRKVTEEEFRAAYHYCQRIIEDFYDERDIVLEILKSKGRVSNKKK